jgi:hypothetical protein
MRIQKPLPGIRTLALIGFASLAFTGCVTRNEEAAAYDSDGQGAFLVSELDQMGQSLGQLPDAPLGKVAESSGIVIRGELVVEPFAYQEDCQCFVRRARYTGQEGFERVRIDSVTFLDSAGEPMDAFRPARVAKVIYSRDVEREKGAREVQVRIDVTVDIKTEGGSKVGVWNGTMTGTFDGQEFKSGTIANVVRPFANGRFGFPESGIIDLTRPVFHYKVEFLGDSKAKVTIRNRLNGRIHVLWVDADYKETEPVETETAE